MAARCSAVAFADGHILAVNSFLCRLDIVTVGAERLKVIQVVCGMLRAVTGNIVSKPLRIVARDYVIDNAKAD